MHNQHIEEPSNEELRVLTRGSALRLLGGAGIALIAGCATDGQSASTTVLATSASTAATNTSSTIPSSTTIADSTTFGTEGNCVLIPEEMAGPYPLDLSGSEQFFRTDITEGKEGLPMTLTMAIVDVNSDCAPLAGARVDLWHCDALGVYSGYQQPGVDATSETFCRGIQLADANGQVTFQTIFPGWYQGRITHVHFQVFLEGGLEEHRRKLPSRRRSRMPSTNKSPMRARVQIRRWPASIKIWFSATGASIRWPRSLATTPPI
jgi:protocatechuate 3,4-dioxygenase beta subunit